MGGMTVLEWPLCTTKGYIRHIIPIATSARHSAWCISWGEAQRQSIYSDPEYADGYYSKQPASGTRGSTHDRIAHVSLARLFREPVRTHATAYTATRQRQLKSSRRPTLRASAPCGRPGRSQRRPPNVRAPRPSRLASPVPAFLGAVLPPLPGKQVRCAFRRQLLHSHHPQARYPRRRRVGVARWRTYSRNSLPRALVIGIETDGLFMLSEQREIAAGIPERGTDCDPVAGRARWLSA
jgi:homoserine O-acetyltransferase